MERRMIVLRPSWKPLTILLDYFMRQELGSESITKFLTASVQKGPSWLFIKARYSLTEAAHVAMSAALQHYSFMSFSIDALIGPDATVSTTYADYAHWPNATLPSSKIQRLLSVMAVKWPDFLTIPTLGSVTSPSRTLYQMVFANQAWKVQKTASIFKGMETEKRTILCV